MRRLEDYITPLAQCIARRLVNRQGDNMNNMRNICENEGIDTPWGRTQHTKELAPGITLVSTSSHGGIILDKAHARRIPKSIVNFLDNEYFWEEDCDIVVPLILFNSEITEVQGKNDVELATEMLRNYNNDWLNAINRQLAKESK